MVKLADAFGKIARALPCRRDAGDPFEVKGKLAVVREADAERDLRKNRLKERKFRQEPGRRVLLVSPLKQDAYQRDRVAVEKLNKKGVT